MHLWFKMNESFDIETGRWVVSRVDYSAVETTTVHVPGFGETMKLPADVRYVANAEELSAVGNFPKGGRIEWALLNGNIRLGGDVDSVSKERLDEALRLLSRAVVGDLTLKQAIEEEAKAPPAGICPDAWLRWCTSWAERVAKDDERPTADAFRAAVALVRENPPPSLRRLHEETRERHWWDR